MDDHEIMRSMAVDYRREAEGAVDPARRDRLVSHADYCQRMAVAMERNTAGAAAGAKPPTAKPRE
jgi:hypothetical protein